MTLSLPPTLRVASARRCRPPEMRVPSWPRRRLIRGRGPGVVGRSPIFRSALFALVPVLLVAPWISVAGCVCYADDYACELKVKPTGLQLLTGSTPDIETEVNAPLGDVQTRAEEHFSDRAEPYYLLAPLPLIGAAGAALFFLRGAAIDASRAALALSGLVLVFSVNPSVDHRLVLDVKDFAGVIGVTWTGVKAEMGWGLVLMISILAVLTLQGFALSLWAGWQSRPHRRPISDRSP